MEKKWMAPVVIGGGAIALVLVFVLIGGRQEPKPDLADDAAPATSSAPAAPSPSPKPTFVFAPAFNQAAPPIPTPLATATGAQNPLAPPTTQQASTNGAATNGSPTDDAAPTPSSTIGMPTAIPTPTKQSVVAEMNLHIDQVKADIARLESEGKHDQAEQKKKVLERLQGQLDYIVDGGD